MTIRDLGYRAYEGELLPASNNTWVLLRYGMWRIWGSWVNRIVVFVAILPLVIYLVLAAIRFYLLKELGTPPDEAETGWFFNPNPGAWLRYLLGAQFMLFVSIVTLRSGAGVIAEDFTNRAYQFYFAKPVTPIQYLLGRSLALAIFSFAIIALPALTLNIVLAGLGPQERLLENFGVLLPTFLSSAIMALTASVLAVAVSSLSRSRALTMTAWIVILFVPLVLAWMIEAMTESEWAYVISIPGLLWVISDALYKVGESWETLRWYYAAPVLAVLTAGGAYLALWRIQRAEVIT
jgi:ABC-2 type transport system permease protein